MSVRPVYIKGTVELSDGRKHEFAISAARGWQQWGAGDNQLWLCTDLLEAMSDAAREHMVNTDDEDDEEEEDDEG